MKREANAAKEMMSGANVAMELKGFVLRAQAVVVEMLPQLFFQRAHLHFRQLGRQLPE